MYINLYPRKNNLERMESSSSIKEDIKTHYTEKKIAMALLGQNKRLKNEQYLNPNTCRKLNFYWATWNLTTTNTNKTIK